jgi:ABC-type branched-subunit amino acid transport system substrate-binding protein
VIISDLKRAVIALSAVTALFFAGCRAELPLEKETQKKGVEEQFVMGEAYRDKGETEKALEAYQGYLDKAPKGPYSSVALHRLAETYLELEQYAKALDFMKMISESHPDYEDLPAVTYQAALTLYKLGQYEGSEGKAFEWLGNYPFHPLRGRVLLLLGENSVALGDNPQAFNWWIQARNEFLDEPKTLIEVTTRTDELIKKSDIEDLQEMKGYAARTEYEPQILHMLSLLYWENNELNQAMDAAMALVRSTPDQGWVSAGRQLLESIQREMSVRPGVVGCILPLTGRFSIYGEEVLNGIHLGMEMFSDSSPGQAMELVIEDTKSDPEKTVAGVHNLVQNERVMAIVGPLSSKTAVAAATEAQRLGVPMIALTQKIDIVEEGDMVFRNFLTPTQEVNSLVDAAMNKMFLRRFAILYPDNSYGRFFMKIFWDRVEEMGGEISAVESYNPSETDFAVEIKKTVGLHFPRPQSLTRKLVQMRLPEEEESRIYPDKPEPIIDFDAVFIPDNFQRVSMIAPQLLYHDISNVLLMGTSLWQDSRLIDMAGDYVQGALFPSGFFIDSSNPEGASFVEDYTSNFEALPGILAATGYDTIRLLSKLMKEKEIHTRRQLRRALLSCRDFEGVTGTISFDSQGEVEKEPVLLTIVKRKMILFE